MSATCKLIHLFFLLSSLDVYCNTQDESYGQYTGDGSVDIKAKPVLKRKTGNWRACPFILDLHKRHESAARDVTTWQGTCCLTPLVGAILVDAYWEDIGQQLHFPQYTSTKPGGSPITRMCQILVASFL